MDEVEILRLLKHFRKCTKRLQVKALAMQLGRFIVKLHQRLSFEVWICLESRCYARGNTLFKLSPQP